MGGWPGFGPYCDLPPWERPGWVYGRGACRYLGMVPGRPLAPLYSPGWGYEGEFTKEQEVEVLETELAQLKRAMDRVEERLRAIKE